jgi:hypothetical protein
MKRTLRFGLAIALALISSGQAPEIDRRVRIVNDSKQVIVDFYGANVTVREWRESLLGDGTLPPGASVVLDFEDGSGYCRFRFRAVFDDGMDLVRESVNVCEVGTYRYTD